MTDNNREKMEEAWKKWGIAEKDLPLLPPDMKKDAFRHACMIGYCEKIVEIYPAVRNAVTPREILAECANIGRLDVIKTLNALGMNDREDMGLALVGAVGHDWPDVACYLIEAGADATVLRGMALDRAAETDNVAMLQMLLATGQFKNDTICETCVTAAQAEKKNVLSAILGSGFFDIHFDNDRLLRHAAKHDRAIPDTLKFLIENGANVHAEAEAPLRMALLIDNSRNIRALLDYGADPVLMSEEGWNGMGKKGKTLLDTVNAAADLRQKEAAEFYKTLTMPDDLTRIVFGGNITGIMVAVRAGKLDDAIKALLEKAPERMTEILNAPVLADRSHFGISFLDLAIRTGQHRAFFQPAIWQDRVTEMKTLCNCLPGILQQEILSGPVYALVQKEMSAQNHRALKEKSNKYGRPKLD